MEGAPQGLQDRFGQGEVLILHIVVLSGIELLLRVVPYLPVLPPSPSSPSSTANRDTPCTPTCFTSSLATGYTPSHTLVMVRSSSCQKQAVAAVTD